MLTLSALRFAQIRYSMLNTSENAFANFSVPDEPSYRLDTCRDRQTDAGSSLSFTGCQVWKHWRSRACMSCSPDAYVPTLDGSKSMSDDDVYLLFTFLESTCYYLLIFQHSWLAFSGVSGWWWITGYIRDKLRCFHWVLWFCLEEDILGMVSFGKTLWQRIIYYK